MGLEARLGYEPPPSTIETLVPLTSDPLIEVSALQRAVDIIGRGREIELMEGREVDVVHRTLSQELFRIIPPDIYNKAGAVLRELLLDGSIKADDAVVAIGQRYEELPSTVIRELVRSFSDTGFVRESDKGKIKLTKLGEKRPSLGYWDVRAAMTASDALRTHLDPIKTSRDISERQKAARDRFRVPEIEIESRNGNRTLWLDGILYGLPVTDTDFLDQVVEHVKDAPEKLKPDAIVVGNIIEGTHKHTGVDATVGLSLPRSDDQFNAAKNLIDRLRQIEAPITYTIGLKDIAHMEDAAIEAVKIMTNTANPLMDVQKAEFLNFLKIHDIKSSREYQTHLIFEHDVAFEYMLRTGRGLMSADEVEAFTDSEVRMEEYLMLWDAYQILRTRWDEGNNDSFIPAEIVPPEYQKIVDVNSIPGPWIKDNFTVVDGVNIDLQGKKDSEVTMWIRNRLKLKGPSLHQEIMKQGLAIVKGNVIDGQEIPEMLVEAGNYEAVGTATRHGVMLNLPGMLSGKEIQQMQGLYAQAGKNPALRSIVTRGRPVEPGALLTGYKKGVMEVEFYDKKLMEAAESVPETTIWVSINDVQTGSPTTDWRRTVNWVRHIVKDIPDRGNVRIIANGDLLHGNIYDKFVMEAPALGLQRTPDQLRLFEAVLRGITSDMSPKQIKQRIQQISSVAGNHEYENRYSSTGNAYVWEIDRVFRDWMGIDIGDPRVASSERVLTREGDFMDAWIIKDKVGEFTVLAQHKILSKGMKGSMNGLPVYQAVEFLKGLGISAEDVNAAFFAHWHHMQFMVNGHKLIMIAPAMAKESSFELGGGYQAVTGGMALTVESGKAPKLIHYNTEALDRLAPKGGMFSDKELNEAGFYNNPDFDPKSDSQLVPTSALHKAVEAIRRDILIQHTKF